VDSPLQVPPPVHWLFDSHAQLPSTTPLHVFGPVVHPLAARHVATPHVPAVLAVQDPAPDGQSVVSPQPHVPFDAPTQLLPFPVQVALVSQTAPPILQAPVCPLQARPLRHSLA
jgi:hypothetical protein